MWFLHGSVAEGHVLSNRLDPEAWVRPTTPAGAWWENVPSAGDFIDDARRHLKLYQAIAKLPVREQMIVFLRWWCEMELEVVGEHMDPDDRHTAPLVRAFAAWRKSLRRHMGIRERFGDEAADLGAVVVALRAAAARPRPSKATCAAMSEAQKKRAARDRAAGIAPTPARTRIRVRPENRKRGAA